ATFIWCCLEEGLDFDHIAAAYAAAFDVPVGEAQGRTADILHQWWALSYLSEVDAPPPSPIGLVTALGRLLTNPSLRDAFAHSPCELARRLGIGSGDVETFAALDHRAVKRQSALLAFRQSSVRRADGAGKKYDWLFVSMAGSDRTLLEAAAESR